MPSAAIGGLRASLRTHGRPAGAPRTVVRLPVGAGVAGLEDRATAAVEFLCAAMVPPRSSSTRCAPVPTACSAACREGDCEFRTGDRLVAARLAAGRKPALRASVPRERVRLVHAGRSDVERLRAELAAFRSDLSRLAPREAHRTPPPKRQEKHHG
jgi:hypothetical protein